MTVIFFGQYVATLASSGFNAIYFWGYRSPVAGRRVGAGVMAFLSLATFLESLMLSLVGRPWALLHAAPWLGARLLVTLASLSITVLILH
ncbi:MAG: hypothetical protein Q8P59_09180, partial [Dehalococcoidia bacterium]|nr:hypothetical protein [Dehalococcoidia bacterium]